MCCLYGVVWGVEGGEGLPVRQHLNGGYRVEPWRASDWLKNDQKKLEVKQSRQSRVYLGFFRPKTGTIRFGPMTGLVGYAFGFISECTCFWPQTDQVYLFLAAVFSFLSSKKMYISIFHTTVTLSLK